MSGGAVCIADWSCFLRPAFCVAVTRIPARAMKDQAWAIPAHFDAHQQHLTSDVRFRLSIAAVETPSPPHALDPALRPRRRM
eukprot:2197522-Rhodomonas_salina.3